MMSSDPADTPTPQPPEASGVDPADAVEAAGTPPEARGDAPQEGWRRWMPRRRVADGAPAQDADRGEPAPRPPTPAEDAPEGATETPPADADAEQPTGTIAAVGADEPARRRWGRGRPQSAAQATTPADADAPSENGDGESADGHASSAPHTDGGVGALRRRRRKLLREREMAMYHLGGLAFELHRHEMLEQEVLRLRAEAVSGIDTQVHEIDTRLEELAADRRERRQRPADPRTPVGNCLTCRAPFQVDARFCWQCGTRLAPAVPDTDDEQTGVITRSAG